MTRSTDTGGGTSDGGLVSTTHDRGGAGGDAARSFVNGSGGLVGGSASTGSGGSSGFLAPEGGLHSLPAPSDVWLGQVERPVTYPSKLGDPPQRVVLIFHQTSQVPSGSITFGDGLPPPAPTDPNAPYPPGNDPTPFLLVPIAGFDYTLVAPRLTGNYLTIMFAPVQLFESWCELQAKDVSGGALGQQAICSCDAGVCHASDGKLQEIDFVMSGDDLDGKVLRTAGLGSSSSPPAIHLHRVR